MFSGSNCLCIGRFLILLEWLVVASLPACGAWAALVEGLLTVLAVVACVVLHEMGHMVAYAGWGDGPRNDNTPVWGHPTDGTTHGQPPLGNTDGPSRPRCKPRRCAVDPRSADLDRRDTPVGSDA